MEFWQIKLKSFGFRLWKFSAGKTSSGFKKACRLGETIGSAASLVKSSGLFVRYQFSYTSTVLILANTFLIRLTIAALASHGAIKDYPGNLSQSKSTARFPPFALSKLILALPSLPHIYLSHWPPVRGYLLPLPRSRVLDVTQLSPALRDIHKTAARETCTLVNLNLFPQT